MAFPSPTKTWHNDTYDAINPSRPELSAKGKTIVVTGGGAGIGARIVEAFAQAGATEIGIIGRREAPLQSTKKDVESKYPSVRVYTASADITDEAGIKKAFSHLTSQFSYGKVDYLISNAGYLPEMQAVRDTTVEEWWKGYEINVKGSFIVTKAFFEHAAPSGAVIVNVSTGAAHVPPMQKMSAYTSSKLAGLKFFEVLQSENQDIRIVSVHPGVIQESDMGAKAKNAGVDLPPDTYDLAAHFTVWAASPDAEKYSGKTLWSNWDVPELKEKEDKLPDGILTTGLNGWGPAVAAF